MAIVNGYATLAEFKAAFFSATDTTDDTDIEGKIQAASRSIDNDLGRRFYTTTADETRVFTATGSNRIFAGDLLTVTSIKIDEDGDRTYPVTLASTDFDLMPENAMTDGRPYTYIQVTPDGEYGFPRSSKGVQIVGTWGYTATGSHPDVVKQACLLQANRWYQRKNAPFGVTAPNEFGQQTVIGALDPDVKHMLDPLRPLWGV